MNKVCTGTVWFSSFPNDYWVQKRRLRKWARKILISSHQINYLKCKIWTFYFSFFDFYPQVRVEMMVPRWKFGSCGQILDLRLIQDPRIEQYDHFYDWVFIFKNSIWISVIFIFKPQLFREWDDSVSTKSYQVSVELLTSILCGNFTLDWAQIMSKFWTSRYYNMKFFWEYIHIIWTIYDWEYIKIILFQIINSIRSVEPLLSLKQSSRKSGSALKSRCIW